MHEALFLRTQSQRDTADHLVWAAIIAAGCFLAQAFGHAFLATPSLPPFTDVGLGPLSLFAVLLSFIIWWATIHSGERGAAGATLWIFVATVLLAPGWLATRCSPETYIAALGLAFWLRPDVHGSSKITRLAAVVCVLTKPLLFTILLPKRKGMTGNERLVLAGVGIVAHLILAFLGMGEAGAKPHNPLSILSGFETSQSEWTGLGIPLILGILSFAWFNRSVWSLAGASTFSVSAMLCLSPVGSADSLILLLIPLTFFVMSRSLDARDAVCMWAMLIALLFPITITFLEVGKWSPRSFPLLIAAIFATLPKKVISSLQIEAKLIAKNFGKACSRLDSRIAFGVGWVFSGILLGVALNHLGYSVIGGAHRSSQNHTSLPMLVVMLALNGYFASRLFRSWVTKESNDG